ncbi:uncharacterized protein [Palaemon carinicauda]|uniref:uncharacterized protein n=1 Tax=Palaemon carinicauda TaxID=392227 RepID=UPI0035B60CFB
MFSLILITIVGICGFAALLEAAVKAVLETGLKTVQLNVCSVRAQDESRLKNALRAPDEESSYSYTEEDAAAGGGRLVFPGDEKEEEGMQIASDGKLLHNEEDATEESQVVEKRSEAICEFEEQQQSGLLVAAKKQQQSGLSFAAEQQQSGLLVTVEDQQQSGLLFAAEQQQSGLLFAAEQQQSGLLVTAEEQQQSGLLFAAEQQQSGLLVTPEEQLQSRPPDAAEEKNDDSVIFGHAVPEDTDAEEGDCTAGTIHRLKTLEGDVTAPWQNPGQQNKVSIKMTVKKEMHCPLVARASYLLQIPLSRKDHPEDVATATEGCKEEEDLAEKDFSRTDDGPKEEWTTYTSLGRHHTWIDAQKIEVPEEPIDQEDQDTILGTLETARVVDDVPTAQAMTKSPATEKEYIDWWNYSSDED